MISLGSNCCISIDIGGRTIENPIEFNSLMINENAGMILPTFELKLNQVGYRMLELLRVRNQKITIAYGPTPDYTKSYSFRVGNYNYVRQKNQQLLIITGTIDLSDFIRIPRIRYIEGTSDEVFKAISSIVPSVNYKGNDKQVWIQHNNTDKNFVERTLLHAYCQEDDAIVGALTVAGMLVVKSIKNAFQEDPILIFDCDPSPLDQSKAPVVVYNSEKLESDSALWSDLIDGRPLPVLSVADRSIAKYRVKSDSLSTQDSTLDIHDNINFPIKIDCGNCHKEYYQAEINNLNYSTQLTKNLVYLGFNKYYFEEGTLKLLDLVQYNAKDINVNTTADIVSGNYIVDEKITFISGSGYYTRIRLVRDFNLS